MTTTTRRHRVARTAATALAIALSATLVCMMGDMARADDPVAPSAIATAEATGDTTPVATPTPTTDATAGQAAEGDNDTVATDDTATSPDAEPAPAHDTAGATPDSDTDDSQAVALSGKVQRRATSERTVATPATSYVAIVVTITGSKKVGRALKVKLNVPATSTTTYQWTRSGKSIGGATGRTYRTKQADIGKKVRVRVTITHPDATLTDTSSGVKITAKKLRAAKPKLTAPSVYSGTRIRVKAKGWTKGTHKSYQWYRGGKKIGGATKSSYRLKDADYGKKIKVKVIGTKKGYKTRVRVSRSTQKVRLHTLTAATPRIGGAVQTGKKVTAKTGSWTKGTKFEYRWYVGSKKVSTSRTYKIKATDAGKSIKVKVTGDRSRYKARSRTTSSVKIKEGAVSPVAGGVNGLSQSQIDSARADLYDLVNDWRAGAGSPLYAADARLESFAQDWAEKLAKDEPDCEQNRPGTSTSICHNTSWTTLTAQGLTGGSENLAQNGGESFTGDCKSPFPLTTFSSWKSDAGHRAPMGSTVLTMHGVGIALNPTSCTIYWVYESSKVQ